MIFFLIFFDASLACEEKSKRFEESDQTQTSRQGRGEIKLWWFLAVKILMQKHEESCSE